MNGKISRKRHAQKELINKAVDRAVDEYGPALKKLGEGAAQEDKIIEDDGLDDVVDRIRKAVNYKGNDDHEDVRSILKSHACTALTNQREEIKEMVEELQNNMHPGNIEYQKALSDLLDKL